MPERGKENPKTRKGNQMELHDKLNKLYIEIIRLMEEGKWEEANKVSAEITKLSAELHKRPI